MRSLFFFSDKIRQSRDTLIRLLKEGITPKKLAWSVTCGVVMGLFPVIGATTILSLGLSFVFRLNIIAVQLVNWLMTPVHLLCLIPFLKLGEWLTGAGSSGLTVERLQAQFVHGFWNGIMLVMQSQLLAVFAWSLLALPLALFIFSVFYRLFRTSVGR